MPFKPTNILVFGATGVIGEPIVDELARQKANSFGRVAIFTSPGTLERKADTIDKFRANGVEVLVGDIGDDDQVRQALSGRQPGGQSRTGSSPSSSSAVPFDTVVSALGRSAIGKQVRLLQLAEDTPTVTRFVPSEYGTDIEYDETSAGEPPHQEKLKVRSFVASSIRRLEYTYLVTGPYADLWLSKMSAMPEMGSFDVENKQATLPFDGETPISFTCMEE